MKFLIEEWSDNKGLSDVLEKKSLPYYSVKYVPFESGNYDLFSDKENVVVIGSINLVWQLQKEKSWHPLAWCNWDRLKYSNYYKNYDPSVLLNYPTFTTIKEFMEDPYQFFTEERIFVRPDHNDKRFQGTDVEFKELKYFREFLQDLLRQNEIGWTDTIVISSYQEMFKEYRLVISNKEIITGSLYRKNDKLHKERVDNFKELQKFITDKVN